MSDELEVDFEEAERLTKSKSAILVFAENSGDVQMVKRLFKTEIVQGVDFNEARIIIMGLGSSQDLMDLAKKYENSVIVCPHGNTSLRMAKTLKEMRLGAYSLKGGLSELRFMK